MKDRQDMTDREIQLAILERLDDIFDALEASAQRAEQLTPSLDKAMAAFGKGPKKR